MVKDTTVGDNIRRLRLESGLTQEELALRSGLSQGYINQLESGKRRFTQKSLEVIANAMSIPMAELFTGEKTAAPIVKKNPKRYEKKPPNKKEFLSLLNELPDEIIEHYLILLKLEKEILEKKGRFKAKEKGIKPPLL